MARVEDLTPGDRFAITRAREVLATAEALDLSDTRAVIRVLARLEVVVSELLDIVDPKEGR